MQLTELCFLLQLGLRARISSPWVSQFCCPRQSFARQSSAQKRCQPCLNPCFVCTCSEQNLTMLLFNKGPELCLQERSQHGSCGLVSEVTAAMEGFRGKKYYVSTISRSHRIQSNTRSESTARMAVIRHCFPYWPGKLVSSGWTS